MTMDLNTIWFLLVGVLLAGYAILDGFDLGVGALHLLARKDEHRRILLNAIGPVWDGNEVWLVTGGGALFAAFPVVYATVFSGFYLAMILLLFALIFRAVSIEFRGKRESPRWRNAWDAGFSVGSVAAALLLGVAFGNAIRGIPIDASGEYSGSFFTLLSPYALLIGVTTVALFTMHGALYLALKTEGDLQATARRWARNAILVFAICYVAATVVTIVRVPRMWDGIAARPFLFAVPVLTLLAIACIPRAAFRGKDGRAFLASCVVIAGLLATAGIGMYPNLVAAADPARALTIRNAASSPKTLTIMLILAGIGMPLVLAYTIAVYRTFRGKVRLDSTSY